MIIYYKIRKEMQQLENFYNNISYKLWIIQLLSVDCDIINILKILLAKFYFKRTIEPLSTEEIQSKYAMGNQYYFSNHEGICFTALSYYGPDLANCKINTNIYYGSNSIVSIYYEYITYSSRFRFYLDFYLSKCDKSKTSALNINRPLILNRWNQYDYIVMFSTS